MTKQELRRYIKGLRNGMSGEQIQQYSGAICAGLESVPQFRNAAVIAFFWPLKGEVDLLSLIGKCLADGKTVLLPAVVGPSSLELRCYSGPECLVSGNFGVMEPAGQAYTGAVDFIVVPGLAFDASGARIGYGKGYYDHLLEKHSASFAAGVCFSGMIVDKVPTEPHDRRMNAVVTDNNVFEITK